MSGGAQPATSEEGGRPSTWPVTWATGSAARFHERSVPEQPVRAVEVLQVDRPALVLGSTQPDHDADLPALDAAGVALVRRRSGGGAVLLEPGGSTWGDVVLPHGDRLWSDDVGVAFHWLGRAWARALTDLGVDAEAHEGPLRASPWSRLVCFAGLGPGEVTVDGSKVVGIAQRRTRGGARFQCALLHRWSAAGTVSLLALDPAERRRATADLAGVARGVDRPASAVVEALRSHLPP